MRIVVTSTAFNAPTASDCAESVRTQLGVPSLVHRFACADGLSLEHATGNGTDAFLSPRKALDNLIAMWTACAPADVIVHLDGDDWLPHDHALASVAADYKDPNVWLTYGRFIRADGMLDAAWDFHFGTRYDSAVTPRQQPWRASHLKTFRAGLVQHLIREHGDYLRDARGALFDTCLDRAVMLSLLELAGPERYRAAPDIRCVYNASHADTMSNRERFRETLDRQRIHNLTPLTMLREATW